MAKMDFRDRMINAFNTDGAWGIGALFVATMLGFSDRPVPCPNKPCCSRTATRGTKQR